MSRHTDRAVATAADLATPAVHPLGSRARVLLSSVFGPYARDDEYGSRQINPMELYHNQVTRAQGPFSLRMFHRSWGLMLIQANVEAPCAVLDFPTLDRFVAEIRDHRYDVVGIGSITTNWLKVRKMCELVRRHQPGAMIVVGGHVANIADLAERIDADWIVRGEGVRWFRRFLGEDVDRPIRHPQVHAEINTRTMGIAVQDGFSSVAATLVPSVGCPMGCNFCATSAMFGGKGHYINFYETGDELFDVMCELERSMGSQSFFVMDENFLLNRPRALRLLELIERNDKAWSLYLFSSARAIRSYSIEQLVSMGLSFVWMGIEGENSRYGKLDGVDTFALVRRLQAHGIRVLGSTIIGLESHTPDNIDRAIDYAVAHKTDFHQFMLYMPLPGTPLHAEMSNQGRIVDESECPIPDTHGQARFNYRHPHIPPGQEGALLLRAFERDFEANGPSILRVARTTLAGWRRYKNHPDPRIRRRFAWDAEGLGSSWAAAAAAIRRYYRNQPSLRALAASLEKDLIGEFGFKARLFAAMGGRYLHRKLRREEKRLARGWTCEPPTYYDFNDAMAAQRPQQSDAGHCRCVTPSVAQETPSVFAMGCHAPSGGFADRQSTSASADARRP